jgi:Zn-dependent protease with chaperone function
MTAATEPRPRHSRYDEPMPGPPQPLLGMYVLTGIVLCCVGACAGQLLYQGDLGLSAHPSGMINQCATRFPFHWLALKNLGAFQRCAAGPMRSEGLVILAVIGAFLLAAVAVSIAVPWIELRRLACAAPVGEIPDVAASFASLCSVTGLARRQRPRLHVAGPGRPVVTQAFTTALPWGRPLIVLPAKVAVARADPDRFDPVVLHELAHVRARDVSWVSSVRGITWLTIPLLALACIPGLMNSQGTTIPGTVLVQAGLFVVITAAFAAGLLRLRELEADRQAARWLEEPDGLRRILSSASPRSSAGWRAITARFLQPLERHPSAMARISALRTVSAPGDTDFTFPFAVGVVTPLAMGTADYLASALDFGGGAWPPIASSAAVGSVILGYGLTPGLIRQAVAARRAGIVASWWRPVAGTAAGLLLGLLVAPTTLPGPAMAVISGAGFEYEAVRIVLTVAAGAGIAALAAALASLAAAGPYRADRGWLAAAASLAVASTAAAALWPIINPATGDVERAYLVAVMPGIQWRWLAAPYLAAALVMGIPLWLRRIRQDAPSRAGKRRRTRAALAPAALPLGAAVIGATLFLPHSLTGHGATGYRVLQVIAERWWMCTLIGWIVLVVLAAAHGVPGLARAWVSAWAATLLAGAELVLYGTAHHHAPDLAIFSGTVVTPSVWLFYLGVPTACLALLPVRSRVPRPRQWLLPVATGSAAIAVTVAIVGLGGPLTAVLFGSPSPPSPSPGPPSPSPPPAAADPGRVLTATAASSVIGDVSTALSGTWTGHLTVTTRTAVGASAAVPPLSPAACEPLAREDFLNHLPLPLVRAAGQYKAVAGVVPIGNATLSVAVDSYAKPVPGAVFTAASQDLRACHRFTVSAPAGTSVFTVRATPPLRLRFPSWHVVFSVVYKNVQSSDTWIVVGKGHNLILITQQTTAFGTLLPPQQAAINAALSAALSGLSHTTRT